MSTILEALKKSEQERKSNDVPTLSDMPVPQEGLRWPLYVIAGLSLVLALVVGVLLSQWFARSDGADTQTQDVQLAPSPSASPAPVISVADEVLVVNVISYSESPSQRFVMLDGKMYRENDFVRAGLKVQEIKPNAVILNMRGELVTRTP